MPKFRFYVCSSLWPIPKSRCAGSHQRHHPLNEFATLATSTGASRVHGFSVRWLLFGDVVNIMLGCHFYDNSMAIPERKRSKRFGLGAGDAGLGASARGARRRGNSGSMTANAS